MGKSLTRLSSFASQLCNFPTGKFKLAEMFSAQDLRKMHDKLLSLQIYLEGTAADLEASEKLYLHSTVLTALEQIQKGAYGECYDCSKPLPWGRQLMSPERIYCDVCEVRRGIVVEENLIPSD